jgi:hypothetical protein
MRLLVLALLFVWLAGASAARADVPRSRLPRATAHSWVVFDGVGVSCLGINTRGHVGGASGLVCFLEDSNSFDYDSAAVELFAWRSGQSPRIDLGSLSAFFDHATFKRLRTHDLHVPVLGAVSMPGTNIVCQSQRHSSLDGKRPGVMCLLTSQDAVIGPHRLNGLITTAKQTDIGFDHAIDNAVRVDGATAFLITSHLVGAVKVPANGSLSFVITKPQ